MKDNLGVILITSGLLLATTAGCVLETPLAVHRLWADYNTLKTPALFCEKLTHEPPPSHRVKEYRWMYNRGPHEIGPYTLIPPAREILPLPVPAEPAGIQPKETTPLVPEPRDGPLIPHAPQPDSGSDGQTPPAQPPVPPLPDTSDRSSLPGPIAHPPAVSSPPRTARGDDWWRFVR